MYIRFRLILLRPPLLLAVIQFAFIPTRKPQATSSPSAATNSLGESELKQSFSTSFKPPNISNGFARTCDVQEVKATLAASQVTVAPKMDHWESLSTIESIFRPFDNSADDNYFVSDESVLDK